MERKKKKNFTPRTQSHPTSPHADAETNGASAFRSNPFEKNAKDRALHLEKPLRQTAPLSSSYRRKREV
jgi:hypothetical protein